MRFFVENTAIELMNAAGLNVVRGLISGLQAPRFKILNYMTFGLLKHYFALQYIMLGERGNGEKQRCVRWETIG